MPEAEGLGMSGCEVRPVKQPVRIQLNGESHSVPAPATVASLVAARKPRPPFAVEVNKQLVRHSQYEATGLAEGDEVEIVTLVGGG